MDTPRAWFPLWWSPIPSCQFHVEITGESGQTRTSNYPEPGRLLGPNQATCFLDIGHKVHMPTWPSAILRSPHLMAALLNGSGGQTWPVCPLCLAIASTSSCDLNISQRPAPSGPTSQTIMLSNGSTIGSCCCCWWCCPWVMWLAAGHGAWLLNLNPRHSFSLKLQLSAHIVSSLTVGLGLMPAVPRGWGRGHALHWVPLSLLCSTWCLSSCPCPTREGEWTQESVLGEFTCHPHTHALFNNWQGW